ncbi:MAG: glycosyltransferase [Oscillatoriales cyanobacterium RM1_1_9]|nr:glycosyltransferase [Oscillatoriales cyanobacterium SM2_3_0]NJO46026.1 glycosyltransferase [Oscillatoriales cyanobacterium RM2_1_1]NJO70983.1 glycosyltransferase [Oscillatoriales cyanobacterium RM1_1_9]
MAAISVIIPVYNGEKTIQETVQSVLNQTFSDIELIVINDGSTDFTLDCLKQISDERLKIFSYPNAGLSASRNRGIARSSGELIAFIDADDLWTADKLRSQWQVLQMNSDFTVAYSWTDYINEYSQFLRRGGRLSVQGNAYPYLLLNNILENGSSPLIRRHAFEEVGTFNESLKAAEDWEMWIRLAARYAFITVPQPQILYRVSSGSMSANVVRQEVETLKVIQQSFAQAPDEYQFLKSASLANFYKYLTFKALDGNPKRRNGLVASQFLAKFLINDPLMLKQRVTFRTLLKIFTVTALPQKQANQVLAKFGKIDNIGALMMNIQVEPF